MMQYTSQQQPKSTTNSHVCRIKNNQRIDGWWDQLVTTNKNCENIIKKGHKLLLFLALFLGASKTNLNVLFFRDA